MIEASGLFAPILGHVGDGNFHVFFILHPDDKPSWQQAAVINDAMIDHALSVGGTCTGENGIGLGERDSLLRENGTASVETELGRAWGREGVCRYGSILEVAGA